MEQIFRAIKTVYDTDPILAATNGIYQHEVWENSSIKPPYAVYQFLGAVPTMFLGSAGNVDSDLINARFRIGVSTDDVSSQRCIDLFDALKRRFHKQNIMIGGHNLAGIWFASYVLLGDPKEWSYIATCEIASIRR